MQPSENVSWSYLLGKLTDQLPPEPLFINKSPAHEISRSVKVEPGDLHVS